MNLHEMPRDPRVSCTWHCTWNAIGFWSVLYLILAWNAIWSRSVLYLILAWNATWSRSVLYLILPSDPEVSCTWYCTWNAIWSWSVLYLILRWNVMWSLTVGYLGFYMKCHMTINCQVPGILHEMPRDPYVSNTWYLVLSSTWNSICNIIFLLSMKWIVYMALSPHFNHKYCSRKFNFLSSVIYMTNDTHIYIGSSCSSFFSLLLFLSSCGHTHSNLFPHSPFPKT